jgi:hypothetical protein
MCHFEIRSVHWTRALFALLDELVALRDPLFPRRYFERRRPVCVATRPNRRLAHLFWFSSHRPRCAPRTNADSISAMDQFVIRPQENGLSRLTIAHCFFVWNEVEYEIVDNEPVDESDLTSMRRDK